MSHLFMVTAYFLQSLKKPGLNDKCLSVSFPFLLIVLFP